MQAGTDGIESVHMTYFPEPGDLTAGLSEAQRSEAADWERLVPVRDQVLKALDNAREAKVIGAPLEAAVVLSSGPELRPLLERYADQLPAWFIVSQVEFDNSAQTAAGLDVHVERARGDKCERCWKFTTDVGSDQEFPTVCAACAAVLQEILS